MTGFCILPCLTVYTNAGDLPESVDRLSGKRASGQSNEDTLAQVPSATARSTERSINYSTLDDALKLLEAEPEPLVDPDTLSQQSSELAQWMDGGKGLSSGKLRSIIKLVVVKPSKDLDSIKTLKAAKWNNTMYIAKIPRMLFKASKVLFSKVLFMI